MNSTLSNFAMKVFFHFTFVCLNCFVFLSSCPFFSSHKDFFVGFSIQKSTKHPLHRVKQKILIFSFSLSPLIHSYALCQQLIRTLSTSRSTLSLAIKNEHSTYIGRSNNRSTAVCRRRRVSIYL